MDKVRAQSPSSPILSQSPARKRIVIRTDNVVHDYLQGRGYLRILNGISVSLVESEIVAIVGPSGSGKSTLLHLLGLMEKPTGGNIYFYDNDVTSLDDDERAVIRNKTIGFLFQFHYLLPEFTLFENVLLPTMINREKKRNARERVFHLLDALGIRKRSHHLPGELSGGEQQRAALARALINHPRIILADEPTGNLDKECGIEIQELLWSQCRNAGTTMILVTHNESLAAQADRVLKIDDGKIISDTR